MRDFRSLRYCVKNFFPLIILALSASAYANDTNNYISYHNQRVHPTNIIAKLKTNSTSNYKILNTQIYASEVVADITLVPGLLVFKEKQSFVKQQNLSSAQRLERRIKQLKATGLFEYVEADKVVHAYKTVNDEAFTQGKLWGLNNDGADGGVKGADINAAKAWDLTIGSGKVIVAVVDTGVRYTHNDLKGQMWKNTDEVADNKKDDDNDGYIDNIYGMNSVNDSGDPMDSEGHGTHVAGTIGAAANDGNKHVGVAWNVSIMACKFLGEGGEGTISGALKAIDFAVKNGAHIINASWGGSDNDASLGEAIAAAGDKGVLFVAAAGNDAADNDHANSFPANYDIPTLISVASITKKDVLASSSSYGASKVHIAAPGDKIFSAWSTSDSAYKEIGGTSMATPHVAGVAALLLSHYPEISALSLRTRILSSATPVASLNNKVSSNGRLNAYEALTIAPDGNLEVMITPASSSEIKASASVNVQVLVSDIDMVKKARVEAKVGANKVTLLDDGVAPDRNKSDGIYSAAIALPVQEGTFSYEVSIHAAGKKVHNQTITYTIIKPLANDHFANRSVITGTLPQQIKSMNKNASREDEEPMIASMGGGASVWWSWTAPSDMKVEINTEKSSFDTLLGVYTGTELKDLKLVAHGDDSDYGVTSSVVFNAQKGVEYQIAVDGYLGVSGNVVLNLLKLGDSGEEPESVQ